MPEPETQEQKILDEAGYNPAKEKLKYVLGKVLKWTAIIGLGGAALWMLGGTMLGGAALGGLPYVGLPAMALGVLTGTGRGLIGSGMGMLFTGALPLTLMLGAGIGLFSGVMGMNDAEANKREDILANRTREQSRQQRQLAFNQQLQQQRRNMTAMENQYGLPAANLPYNNQAMERGT